MIISFISLLVLFLITAMVLGYFVSAPSYHGSRSQHYTGKKFKNPGDIETKGFKDLLKWVLNRNQGRWNIKENIYDGRIEIPHLTNGIRIYFINHSTFLIQAYGTNILTDPIWGDRAGPFNLIGPERKRPPGIMFKNIPDIDLILLSHNHYDHLDLPTLKKLNEKYRPEIISPLGMSRFLLSHGILTAADMDWWDENSINDKITIACVPAQHFSGRGMFDRDKTLWAGYVIKTTGGNIYFAGDTGYGNFFKDIKKRYSPINIAILPIGAYKPEWFMSPIHLSPSDAVHAHMDLSAKLSIACHYGTFPLADDGMTQPEEDLMKAKKEMDVNNFILLDEGHFIDLN